MSLLNMSIGEFLEELASGAPAPGGGSVAALCGALSSALCAMVARTTHGKEKYRDAWGDMEVIMLRGDRLRNCFLELMEADLAAYNQVVNALRMPKGTAKERESRSEAIEQANRRATEVPLKTATLLGEIIQWIELLLDRGNTNCISDMGTALQLIRLTAFTTEYNVAFNLTYIPDAEFVEVCRMQLEQTIAEIEKNVDYLVQKVVDALK